MSKWNLDKENLHTALNQEVLEGLRRKPYLISESGDKTCCVIVYGLKEPRMGYVYGNFIILKYENHRNHILAKTDGNHIACWIDNDDNVSWSKDSRYAVIDIYPAITRYLVAYRDAKFVADVKEEKFTIVLVSGSERQQGLRVDKNGKVEIFARKGQMESNISLFIEKAETKTSSLKWVKLSRFNKAISMLENGYFGDIVGYKNPAVNIRFKNGYIPWPYKGIVKRRPKQQKSS